MRTAQNPRNSLDFFAYLGGSRSATNPVFGLREPISLRGLGVARFTPKPYIIVKAHNIFGVKPKGSNPFRLTDRNWASNNPSKLATQALCALGVERLLPRKQPVAVTLNSAPDLLRHLHA